MAINDYIFINDIYIYIYIYTHVKFVSSFLRIYAIYKGVFKKLFKASLNLRLQIPGYPVGEAKRGKTSINQNT